MTATLLPNAKQQFLDSNGRPLAGGAVYFYIPNTSFLKSTWQDAGKTVLNTNPVVLDANGQAIIYGDGQYRQVVYDVHGNLIWDRLTDSPALNSEFQSFVSSIGAPTGSSLINFIQAGVGAVKRTVQDELRETVKLTQFYVVGEAGVAPAFVRALAAFTRPGTLEIPQGFFNLDAMVTVRSDIPIKIRGAGMNSTILFCSSAGAIQAMFKQSGDISDTFELSGMTLLGNSKAGSGYLCENVIASTFRDLAVQGTTSVAIRTNNGYSNTFDNVKLFSNSGGGLQCTGIANNNINIRDSQFYANGGIGLELGNGFSVTISGTDIETNAVAGLMAYDIKSLTIRDSYVERNGATGYAYTIGDGSPENLTVHSDIHLLSGGKTIGGLLSTAVTQCTINNVQFTPYGTGDIPSPGLSIDSPVFATVVDGLSVTNCEVLDTTKIKQMVSFYNNNTKSSAYQCVIDGNTTNTVGFLGTTAASFAFSTMHNVDTPLAQGTHNYAAQDLSKYAILSGSTGALVRSATNYKDYPVLELSGNYQFGYDLDLTLHPELKGQVVWFGLWYHVDDTGSTVQLALGGNADTDGTVTDSAMAPGVFVFKSVCKKVDPTDTVLFLAIQRVGIGSNPIKICNPVVSLAGFGANRYPIPNGDPVWWASAAPSTGTWPVGTVIRNLAPSAGGFAEWACTTSPATFKTCNPISA